MDWLVHNLYTIVNCNANLVYCLQNVIIYDCRTFIRFAMDSHIGTCGQPYKCYMILYNDVTVELTRNLLQVLHNY